MQVLQKVLLNCIGYTKCIYIVIFILLQRNVNAYNVDVDDMIVISDPYKYRSGRENYFGFSTALYVANTGEPSVIVGAPRSNTSEFNTIVEPGVVFKCTIDNICKEWILDKSGNNWIKQFPSVRQIKDNAWIGATVAVGNQINPEVVVCGPRWKNNIISQNRANWFLNGICYSAIAGGTDFFEKEAEKILPLVNGEQVSRYNGQGVYNYGMGQIGFSVHIPPNATDGTFIYGAPGIYYWTGIALLEKRTNNIGRQTIIPRIRDDASSRSGDYFGYAVTSGHYFKKEERLYAAGVPRGENIYGCVYIFSFPAKSKNRIAVKKIINGERYGEYFGSALATCDLNNDGRDDLIVGAPMWSKHEDEGRIYIFLGRQSDNFERQFVSGEKVGARFGSAVTCLGDIDYDSYGDLAVGAPYEDETGAVYIFNGNKNGLSSKYSQRIVGQGNFRGFGSSISEPRDINGDKYPDIAVGAYLSGHVVLLRSTPVVTITTELVRIGNQKLSGNSTMFNIDQCTSYHGVYVPESLNITILLKVDEEHGRAYSEMKDIVQNESSRKNVFKLSQTLFKDKTLCKLFTFKQDNVQNVIDPLLITTSIHIDNSTNDHYKNFSCPHCTILNKLFSKTEDTLKLSYSVDCGEDEICMSDLDVALFTNLNFSEKYIIGSGEILKLSINVSNYGEAAYQAKLLTYIPESLTLASLPRECMENGHVNDNLEVLCNLNNPLNKEQIILLELDMSAVRFDMTNVTFSANVTTQSEEINFNNNMHRLTVYFDMDVDIGISGKARDDSYSYFREDKDKQLESIRFQHFYEVQNFGVSPVEAAVLSVLVPTHWINSDREIEIARINETNIYMNGHPGYCSILNRTKNDKSSMITKLSVPTIKYEMVKTHPVNESKDNATLEKLIIKDDSFITLPPESRTEYVNCSNPAYHCKRIECMLGSFLDNLSIARFLVTIDLQLSNLQDSVIKGKEDIIFFVSEGSVNITDPPNIIQTVGHKPDSVIVTTTFVGTPIAEKIAIWIIILSVFIGIILLILLIIGLVKAGFFNRKKKEELDALKAETDIKYQNVTSSTEDTM